MSWLDNENNRTQVSDGWLPEIPAALRRDRTTNKAPWQNMPTYGGNLAQHTVQSRAFKCLYPECDGGPATPEANPPASNQEWLPPWGSKT